MKKNIIRLIILMILLSIIPNFDNVYADSNYQSDVIEINTEEIVQEMSEDFGADIAEQLDMDAKIINKETLIVESEIETEDFTVSTDVEYSLDDGFITVDGIYEDNGERFTQSFDVIAHHVDGEEFIATFIDQETGEIYDINTIEAQASAWPAIIIAIVARYGINYAIKKYGKKQVTNVITKHSYGKVLSCVSKLDKNKINHIMQSKHNWNKVTKNGKWDEVSQVISHVMRYGTESSYKSVKKKTLKMNNHTVVVTFKRVNGEIKISNEWVE